MIHLKTIDRTCVACDEVFVQDFLEILQCICPDCKKGIKKKEVVIPETIEEHIKEEIEKSPHFKVAFDEETKKLESEVNLKNGTDNCDNGESGKSI